MAEEVAVKMETETTDTADDSVPTSGAPAASFFAPVPAGAGVAGATAASNLSPEQRRVYDMMAR